jgi:hypothetical protein
MRSGSPPRWQQPSTSVWTGIGIALGVVLAIGGLVVVGALVIFFVGMSHYGSNK